MIISAYEMKSRDDANFDSTKEVIHTQEEPYNLVRSNFSRAAYCNIAKLETFKDTGKPLMLIEYAHAMGNSPGGLQRYWDYIYDNDNACGGFVWEFKSHGFCAVDGSGKEYPLYGGDFGDEETYNWYNFCLDGFLTSDGTPKPTWYDLGEVIAPICAQFDGELKITNTNDFRNADYISMIWELREDYIAIKSGKIDALNIEPHQTIVFGNSQVAFMPDSIVSGANYYLDLRFFDGDRMLSHKQLKLPYHYEKNTAETKKFKGSFTCENNSIKVETDNCSVVIKNAMLAGYIVNDYEIISKPMRLNFYRAATDNDGIMADFKWFPKWFFRRKSEWAEAFLKTLKFWVSDTTIKEESDALHLTFDGKILPDTGWMGYNATIEYRILSSGLVTVQIVGKPFGKMTDVLPRIGVIFELADNLKNVEWYGRGEMQNYCDSLSAAPIGIYNSDVKKLNFMFDVPQETGNHENTKFVSVSDSAEKGITVVGCDEFSFSYHDFSLDNLDDAHHKNEVIRSDENYLYIDYKVRGLGSRSCGPEPEEEFEIRPHSFKFGFALCSLRNKNDALNLARCDLGVKTEKLSDTYKFEDINKVEQVANCTED